MSFPAWMTPDEVPLPDVEKVLAERIRARAAACPQGRQWARMSNLVVYCDSIERAEAVAAELLAIITRHPARVLLLVGEAPGQAASVAASVALCLPTDAGPGRLTSEVVLLRAGPAGLEHLPFAVRRLLIGDLPTNVWWAATAPPPLAGNFLFDLCEHAQQVIYDSAGWTDPALGVSAIAAWLTKLEPGRRGLVASDLGWRRVKFWRRLLTQTLDPATAPGAISSIREVRVEHGPHAVIQAWELVTWLASRLGWKVQNGRCEPGISMSWQVAAPHGSLRVHLQRLADAPPDVRRIQVTCATVGFDCVADDSRRLAAIPQGDGGEPRTITVQPQPLAELVARQLSDRERDPVFEESIAAARDFARKLLEA